MCTPENFVRIKDTRFVLFEKGFPHHAIRINLFHLRAAGSRCVHCQLDNDPSSRFLTARTAVVREAERVAKSVSGVPYRRSSQGPNDVRRIEFITISVDELHRVAQWYVVVLGAREIDFCDGNTAHCHDGIVRYAGDDHQTALVGSDVDQKARPDISAAGSSEAQSRFFILGNGVVQLLKIAGRVTDHAFDLHEPRTSPVWVGQAHTCFWVDSGLDANEYIASVERNSHDRDMTQVKFNRPCRRKPAKIATECPSPSSPIKRLADLSTALRGPTSRVRLESSMRFIQWSAPSSVTSVELSVTAVR